MRRSGSTMQYLDSYHHSCSVRPWPLAVLALFRAFFKNWLRPQIMPEIAHSCQCCTDFFSLFQERVSPFWQHLKHDLPDWLQAFYRKNLWLDPKFAIWGGCPKTNETIWMRQAKQHDRHCCTNLMQFIFSGIRNCRKHGVYGCLWYVYGMSIRLSQCLNMFKSFLKCCKLMMQCLALPLLCPDLMASFDRNPQRGSLLAPFHALPNWLQTTVSRKKDGEPLWNILEIRWNRMN